MADAEGGPSDAELLRRFVADRDDAAFGRLVGRHATAVRAAAGAVARDGHLAEDATQVAFLAPARQADTVRDNPAGWLHRVARRTAGRMRRATPAALPLLPGADDHPPGPSAAGIDADERAVLHAELAALPDEYRLPLCLCFFDGLTHAQPVGRLGWPVGTVAGRIARGKDRLRTRLARRGVTTVVVPLAAADTPLKLPLLTAAVAVGFRLVAAGRNDGTLTRGERMVRRFFVWCLDLNVTWAGLGHLRPAKHESITLRNTLIVGGLWGLPALALGPVIDFRWRAVVGDATALRVAVFVALAAWVANLCLSLISTLLWNGRAAELRTAAEPA